jgi:hypothetical protein
MSLLFGGGIIFYYTFCILLEWVYFRRPLAFGHHGYPSFFPCHRVGVISPVRHLLCTVRLTPSLLTHPRKTHLSEISTSLGIANGSGFTIKENRKTEQPSKCLGLIALGKKCNNS